MTLTGTIYLSDLVNGKVNGAVFFGTGKFRAEVPPNEFESNNLKRLLDTDVIENEFKTAVFRFSDDTFSVFEKNEIIAPENAQKLANELEPLLLKQSGLNLSARLTQSI
jgi:hypothetical protein